jgi:Tannase and feruloyl esterase/Zinc-binding dehydrogenase
MWMKRLRQSANLIPHAPYMGGDHPGSFVKVLGLLSVASFLRPAAVRCTYRNCQIPDCAGGRPGRVTTARLNKITELFESGKIATDVGTVLPLGDARIAHGMLAGRPHRRGKIVLADSIDLDGFIDRKAKNITYHGMADQLIFSRGTTNYFERLHKRYGAPNVDKFARLFRVPGMGHCAGGPGPNSFGQNGTPGPFDPQHDIFQALVNWVEFGVAPDEIIATKFVSDNPANGVAFTRPLCVFPKVAQYKGVGNPADAANWACVKGVINDTTEQADAVLPGRGDGDQDGRPRGHD